MVKPCEDDRTLWNVCNVGRDIKLDCLLIQSCLMDSKLFATTNRCKQVNCHTISDRVRELTLFPSLIWNTGPYVFDSSAKRCGCSVPSWMRFPTIGRPGMDGNRLM